MLASAIGTAVGNPWTFPLIWAATYELGTRLGFGTDAGGDEVTGLWQRAFDAASDFEFTTFLELAWPLPRADDRGRRDPGPAVGTVLLRPSGARRPCIPGPTPRRDRTGAEAAPVSLRLGVNVDHVATVRNARGADHPDPVRAALEAAAAGADGITAHLREDRRHIRDGDIRRLRDELPVPLNLEMAPNAEMAGIASDVAPHAVCLVPERREELTTEGGLDVAGIASGLEPTVARLRERGIRVSMFIEPDRRQIEASRRIGAPVVELHTGRYCTLSGGARAAELERIREAAEFAAALGLEPHAGHGAHLRERRSDRGHPGPLRNST